MSLKVMMCGVGAFGLLIAGLGIYAAYGTNSSTQSNQCGQIATEDQATKLITRLFPDASILSADTYSLDNTKSVCLLEVEMQVVAGNPATQGFVYVLPDGEHFLNGPLMNKRSKIVTAIQPDVAKAIGEQQNELAASFSAGVSEPAEDAGGSEQALPTQQADQAQIPTMPDPAELREKLITKLQQLPTIEAPGEGKPVYVLIDPLCTHCKRLIKESSSIAESHGIKFHWVPMFLNEGGWALSAYLLKTNRESPDTALAALEKVMAGKLSEQEITSAISTLSEEDYAEPKEATAVFIELAKYNSRLGTPLVVFRKPSGGVEVISGMPHDSDWNEITAK